MQQTQTEAPTAYVVEFAHERLNYDQPRYIVVDSEETAQDIDAALSIVFADDEAASSSYQAATPAEFVAEHPLQIGSEDEYDLDEAVRYDEDNPHHVAWMKEVRALLAD